MIFVILGTQDKSFDRLLEAIERTSIQEEIIVQAGYTKFESKKMKIVDYISAEEFRYNIEHADLIICHGGVGTIMQALEFKRKVIAVPRLASFGEHHNDHQVEIVNTFVEKKHILTIDDLNDLEKIVETAKSFEPQPFKSNNLHFIALIEQFIKETS